MTNERYLIVSYVWVCAISAGVGILVYLFLRRPFAGVADAATSNSYSSLLKRLFPWGLLFPALLGFVVVSYQGCSRSTYQEIIKSRDYLVEKNQQQLSSILVYTLIAVVFWDGIILLTLKFQQKITNKSQPPKLSNCSGHRN